MFWDEIKTCPMETSMLLSEFPFKGGKVRESKLQVFLLKQKCHQLEPIWREVSTCNNLDLF